MFSVLYFQCCVFCITAWFGRWWFVITALWMTRTRTPTRPSTWPRFMVTPRSRSSSSRTVPMWPPGKNFSLVHIKTQNTCTQRVVYVYFCFYRNISHIVKQTLSNVCYDNLRPSFSDSRLVYFGKSCEFITLYWIFLCLWLTLTFDLVYFRNSVLWTPLDCAAAKGWLKTVKCLLDADAPIDPMDKTKVCGYSKQFYMVNIELTS